MALSTFIGAHSRSVLECELYYTGKSTVIMTSGIEKRVVINLFTLSIFWNPMLG